MSHEELSVELLEEVFAGVLEEAAFIFVEQSEIDWEGASIVRARVSFEGEARGELSIASTASFADVLAANLLGLEPGEGADGYGEDALKELANIFGGAFLARWLGADSGYRMGIPSSAQVTEIEQEAAASAATCRLPLIGDDEYQIDVSVSLEGA